MQDLGKVIVIIAILVISIWLIYSYSSKSTEHLEKVSDSVHDRAEPDDLESLDEQSIVPKSSYANGNRGGDPDQEIDRFFNSDMPHDFNNDGFQPHDSGHTQHSEFVPSGSKTKLSDKDKFDVDALMPKETGKDWFEDVNAVDIQDTRLININRVVSVNTIGTSNKNASHDLRGTPAVEKTLTPVWNNSSIEPNTYCRDKEFCH